MSLSEMPVMTRTVARGMSSGIQRKEAIPVAAVARIVARVVGQLLAPSAFEPLPGGRTGLGLWRVRLEQFLPTGASSLVAKVVPDGDRESHLLRWLMERGHLAPHLYHEIPLNGQYQLLLLEDVGDCGLLVDWPKQPRLADAVVEWLSQMARLAIPDPVPAAWACWRRRDVVIAQFERAWAAIRELQAVRPGLMSEGEFDLLAAVFARRAIIAQRLQPMCRRLIHGDLEPGHLRGISEVAIRVRAVDWGQGGCGPLAFDLYDLVWALPDPDFEQALENLICLMPSDVRPELTPPVLRLAGGAKAFLHAGRAAAEHLQAFASGASASVSRSQIRVAVSRLQWWYGHVPAGIALG